MLSPGRKARGGEVALGVRSLFSQFCPLPGTGSFPLGDHLYLAVNCSATVFSSLSQFPCSIRQGILLPSHYPVSVQRLSQRISKFPGVVLRLC